jgi:hypothetical protein
MATNSYKSYVYQMFVQGEGGLYYEVKTYLGGNYAFYIILGNLFGNSYSNQPVKRFFL